jgi:hypothetical protein
MRGLDGFVTQEREFDQSASAPCFNRYDIVTGFGAAAAVPEQIKLAIKQAVMHFYENRTGTELPSGVRMLLDPFRSLRVW